MKAKSSWVASFWLAKQPARSIPAFHYVEANALRGLIGVDSGRHGLLRPFDLQSLGKALLPYWLPRLQYSQPSFADLPMRKLCSRPSFADLPMRKLCSRPSFTDLPMRKLCSRPLFAGLPLRKLFSQPLFAGLPMRMSSPTTTPAGRSLA